jgi:carbon storage regulator
MLVLSRKIGEAICIGDEVRIRVVAIQGNQVRLGIEAPDDIKILRTELMERQRPPCHAEGSAA